MSALVKGVLEAMVEGMQSRCVITGCGLVEGNAWSWGDLHEFGGLWVFHGASHATDWLSYDAEMRQQEKKCLILEPPNACYFVRRGVWVIAKTGSRLNGRAVDYLNGVK